MTSVLCRYATRRIIKTNKRSIHFWLRAETKEDERRTILLPQHAKELLFKGHTVSVEECPQRCVPTIEYSRVGCKIVPWSTWQSSPTDAVILGLKELPDVSSITHKHVMFGHCYKGQAGSKNFLQKFVAGGGQLFDLEFLVDSGGRRVAAFGTAAGKVGMAVGLLVWAWHKRTSKPFPSLSTTFKNYQDLANHVTKNIEDQFSSTSKTPACSVLIIGAKGRVGKGADSFMGFLPQEIQQKIVIHRWDVAETAGKSGPFPEILQSDIFANSILLPPPPSSTSSQNGGITFINDEILQKTKDRNLSVIADLSCDASNPRNPIQLHKYKATTNFVHPTLNILPPRGSEPGLELIAIDHLPTLVPYESSKEFGDSIVPYLSELGSSSPLGLVWASSLKLFFLQTKSL